MLDLLRARYLFYGLFALTLLALVYAVASAPSRVASRLGMRGLKRQRAIESNSGWAQIEPLVRWLAVRVSGLVSEDMARRIDEHIGLAGDYLGLTPEEYVSLSIISCAGGALAGMVMGYLSGSIGMF